MQYIVRETRSNADIEGLQPGANSGNRSVMVRALDIDGPRKSALPLRYMVGNIRNKVGIAAIRFAHDPVFVITKIRCPQPQSALVFIGVAGLNQLLDCILNPPILVE